MMPKTPLEVGFKQNGYALVSAFLNETELKELRLIVARFHEAWLADNLDFYREQAINSAYLTAPRYLLNNDRQALFHFLSSTKLITLVQKILGEDAAFMNTQLFFNPLNPLQANYWHRDTQYHLSVEEQKQALGDSAVVHFRLPLFGEPGIELIPNSHQNWDTPLEHKVRLQTHGHKHHEDLPAGKVFELNAGDVFMFDANMIHRGIYGKQRMALDVLFAKPRTELFKFADASCFPTEEQMACLEAPSAFKNGLACIKA